MFTFRPNDTMGRSLWRDHIYYNLNPAEWSNSHTYDQAGRRWISLFIILIWYSSDIKYIFRDILPDCFWSRDNIFGRARETFPLHYSRITPFARPGFLKLYIMSTVYTVLRCCVITCSSLWHINSIMPLEGVNRDTRYCHLEWRYSLLKNRYFDIGPSNCDIAVWKFE